MDVAGESPRNAAPAHRRSPPEIPRASAVPCAPSSGSPETGPGASLRARPPPVPRVAPPSTAESDPQTAAQDPAEGCRPSNTPDPQTPSAPRASPTQTTLSE